MQKTVRSRVSGVSHEGGSESICFFTCIIFIFGRSLQVTVRLCYENTHGVALSIGMEDIVVGDRFCGDSHMFVRGYGMGMGI